jgi:galactose mutarotase-like enzyme
MLVLQNDTYTATFNPKYGMNMLSFRRGDIEAIQQTTRPLFDERRAGLGALIGPHFHHRAGIEPEPYSHGIARQLPWTVEHDATTFSASLQSDERTAALQGQAFTLFFHGKLTPAGLTLALGVSSEKPSVVGFHYYYALPGPSTVHLQQTTLPLDQPYDNNYPPSDITLQTPTHTLNIHYTSSNPSNTWQLWHPQDADFVCIEPLSARDPRQPTDTASSVTQTLSITPNEVDQ